jgi:hypothetical protein
MKRNNFSPAAVIAVLAIPIARRQGVVNPNIAATDHTC